MQDHHLRAEARAKAGVRVESDVWSQARAASRRIWPALLQGLRGAVSAECPLCGAAARGGDPCRPCLRELGSGGCWPVTGGTGAMPSRIVHAFCYAPPGDVLIWQFKNGRRLRHARMLAGLMARAVAHQAWRAPPGAVLVPIPSSRSSLRRRGYNPARELSRSLSRLLGLPERPGWLVRSETPHKQAGLDRRQRRAILEGVFRCPTVLPPVCVVLVDDVVTTGSTVTAAARALLAAGATEVVVLAAARVEAPCDS